MKNQDRDRTTKKQDEDDDSIVARGRQDSGLSTPAGERGRMSDDVIDEDDDVEPGSRGRTADKSGPSPTTRKK